MEGSKDTPEKKYYDSMLELDNQIDNYGAVAGLNKLLVSSKQQAVNSQSLIQFKIYSVKQQVAELNKIIQEVTKEADQDTANQERLQQQVKAIGKKINSNKVQISKILSTLEAINGQANITITQQGEKFKILEYNRGQISTAKSKFKDAQYEIVDLTEALNEKVVQIADRSLDVQRLKVDLKDRQYRRDQITKQLKELQSKSKQLLNGSYSEKKFIEGSIEDLREERDFTKQKIIKLQKEFKSEDKILSNLIEEQHKISTSIALLEENNKKLLRQIEQLHQKQQKQVTQLQSLKVELNFLEMDYNAKSKLKQQYQQSQNANQAIILLCETRKKILEGSISSFEAFAKKQANNEDELDQQVNNQSKRLKEINQNIKSLITKIQGGKEEFLKVLDKKKTDKLERFLKQLQQKRQNLTKL